MKANTIKINKSYYDGSKLSLLRTAMYVYQISFRTEEGMYIERAEINADNHADELKKLKNNVRSQFKGIALSEIRFDKIDTIYTEYLIPLEALAQFDNGMISQDSLDIINEIAANS